MKLRTLTIGLTLLTAGTVIGVSTQQFVSADVSTGDRPVLVPIAPCRLVDTRPAPSTVGPRATKLGVAETLTVDAQQPSTPCTGLVPTDALSLALNITAIGASELSFLTIWSGGARPIASSLNPAPGEPPTPNAVTVDLAADQKFQIYNNLGSLDLLVDVIGYYENHNHDDRYLTGAQVGSVATPTFTEITYEGNGTLTRPAGTPTPEYVRDLGTFTSSGGTVKTNWNSFVSKTSASAFHTCHFQIRIDGQASRELDSSGLAGTEAKLGGDEGAAVPASGVDVFEDLAPGLHTVELWTRTNRAGSCFDNPSGWPNSVLIEEFPS